MLGYISTSRKLSSFVDRFEVTKIEKINFLVKEKFSTQYERLESNPRIYRKLNREFFFTDINTSHN